LGDISESEYREFRLELLKRYCFVSKLICPEAEDIVGVATEPGVDTELRSEDAIAFDARDWTHDHEAEARRIQQETGILANVKKTEDRVFEFPLPPPADSMRPGKNPRNKPCPCGSGKKYKRCHGL
jgi:preprotein translocase subunit SecA